MESHQSWLSHLLYSIAGDAISPVIWQHILSALLVLLFLSVLSFIAKGQLAKLDNPVVPSPKPSVYNVLESGLGGLYSTAQKIIGPEASHYFPVIATLALFILFSNLLGLVPGFLPPTDSLNTTLACGLFVFIYYNFHGLRVNGWKHVEHLANPAGEWWGWFLAPLMLPLELVSHMFRPITLAIRLAANMTADHAVLGAFLGAFGVLSGFLGFAPLLLGILVCCIQTAVFCILAMVYLGMAVETHDHDHHGHHDDGDHGHSHDGELAGAH